MFSTFPLCSLPKSRHSLIFCIRQFQASQTVAGMWEQAINDSTSRPDNTESARLLRSTRLLMLHASIELAPTFWPLILVLADDKHTSRIKHFIVTYQSSPCCLILLGASTGICSTQGLGIRLVGFSSDCPYISGTTAQEGFLVFPEN